MAVEHLLDLKGRSVGKGLIVIAASLEQLEPFVDLSDPLVRQRVSASWPGPVTCLLPKAKGVPPWLSGEHGLLAARVTAHPIAAGLCRRCGPVVSTSANPQGRQPALNPLRLRFYFADSIDYVLPGTLGGLRGPTEIRDGLSGRIVRPSAGQKP